MVLTELQQLILTIEYFEMQGCESNHSRSLRIRKQHDLVIIFVFLITKLTLPLSSMYPQALESCWFLLGARAPLEFLVDDSESM